MFRHVGTLPDDSTTLSKLCSLTDARAERPPMSTVVDPPTYDRTRDDEELRKVKGQVNALAAKKRKCREVRS